MSRHDFITEKKITKTLTSPRNKRKKNYNTIHNKTQAEILVN